MSTTLVRDVAERPFASVEVSSPVEDDTELLREVERRIVNSFQREYFFPEYLYRKAYEEIEVGVADAASVLDELVPDWHLRIDREIIMTSVYSCVLGQVFGPGPNEPFNAQGVDGYLRGMLFFKSVGYNPPRFVFSSTKAYPFWMAEVAKRTGGAG